MNAEQNGPRLVTGGLTKTQCLRSCAMADDSIPTSVYRYYDKNDLLLYVGITSRGIGRQREHNTSKEWWKFVVRQDVEHYKTRRAALNVERELIQRFRPPFNVQHNPDHIDTRDAYMDLVAAPSRVRNVKHGLIAHGNSRARVPLDVHAFGPGHLYLSAKVSRWPTLSTKEIDSAPFEFIGMQRGGVKLLEASVVESTLHLHVSCRDGADRCRSATAMLRMPNAMRTSVTVKRVTLSLFAEPVAPRPVPTARQASEPISIGDALAGLLPHLRTCSVAVGPDGHCGRPATNGECTYHADERAAFYTTPKGR